MEDSWEGLLDILELSENDRKRANLEVLMEFPLGYPEKTLLINLYESIIKLYGRDSNFSIVWFKRSDDDPDISNLYKKIVGTNDIKFIQDFWLCLSGNYILFLPKTFDINKIGSGDEEKIIGKILSKYGQLLLKTPDGNEILHVYLNNK